MSDRGPSDQGQSLRAELAAQGLLLDIAIGEVVSALQRAGIDVIVLKGPSIANWLYESRADRPYADGDLLVRQEDHALTERFLESLGFETERFRPVPGDRISEASEWHRDDGIIIDLHFTLAGALAPPQVVWGMLSQHVTKMVLRRNEIDVLDVPARAMHVAIHAAHHGPHHPHPLRDLELALQNLSQDVWVAAAVVAHEIQATDAMTAGLDMVPQGQALVKQLGLQPPTNVDVALRAASAPAAAFNVETFASLSGASRKIRFLIGKLFPPPGFLRNRSPLARRGAMGLTAAYIARPFVVIARLGPGLVAWARARRETRKATEGRR